MMTISEPRLRSLLRRAEKVAASGKRAAAAMLYRQIVAEAPEAEAAWLGLAGVVNDVAAKTAAYERALQINPGNEAAKAGLAQLRDGSSPADPFEQSRDWLEAATAPPKKEELVVVEPEPAPDVGTAVAHPDDDHEQPRLEPAAEEFNLVCTRHPDRETSLRCYNCNQPICIKCAVKTPVGYSCPDCLRELQKGYYTATMLDYIVAFIVALPLSILAAYLVGALGFFTFFVSPVAGTFIGRIVFWAARRHRGRWLAHLVAGTVILGAVIKLAAPFFLTVVMALLLPPEQIAALYTSGGSIIGLLLSGGSLIWTGIYAFMAAAAAFYFVKV